MIRHIDVIFLKSSSGAALTYLSLVVLCVEELCVLGKVDHCSDVVLGLVDDGQVEQPVEAEREGLQYTYTTQPHLQDDVSIRHKETSDRSPYVTANTHTSFFLHIYHNLLPLNSDKLA